MRMNGEIPIPIDFQKYTCQAVGCEYNLKFVCTHEGIGLDERGKCIFNTTKEVDVKHCFVSYVYRGGRGFQTMEADCTTVTGIADIHKRLEKEFGGKVVIISLKELKAD